MCDLNSLLSSLSDFRVNLEDFKESKCIGRGSFGEVIRAKHKETDTICAIKKLYLDKLEGVDLQSFVREVNILSSCNDTFILPFQGFTVTKPFSIITEYEPNGTLFDALHHKIGSPHLSASHKTLIAIGIAHGMMELHHHNVIHRDLKSLNILLDERILPRICDFGASRFARKDDEMTKEVGTPSWMAPETFETDKYTEKIDVYSYGIILWEMLTELFPFKGKNAVQVATAVCMHNERPKIPSSCPSALKSLIQKCWDRDPEKRPSFKQIFKAFADKKIVYRDTDPRSVNAILMVIEEDKKKREKDPKHHLIKKRSKDRKKAKELKEENKEDIKENNKEEPKETVKEEKESSKSNENIFSNPFTTRSPFSIPNNFINDDSLNIMKMFEFPEQKEDKTITKKTEFEDILNPEDPNFPSALEKVFNSLTIENAEDVFRIIIPYLQTTVSPSVTSIVLDKMVNLFKRNSDYLITFYTLNMHKMIPLHDDSFFLKASELISIIISNDLNKLQTSTITKIVQLATKFPDTVMKIISEICLSINNVPDKNAILSAFFSLRATILTTSQAIKYLRVTFYLYKTLEAVKEKYFKDVERIITECFDLPDFNIVKEVYSFVLTFRELMKFILVSKVITHLKNTNLQSSALSFIANLETIPQSDALVKELVLIKDNKTAVLILCRIAENFAGAPLIIENDEWMDFGADDMFCILATLFTVKAARQIISQHKRIPELLNKALESNDRNVLTALPVIIRRMTLSLDFINNLSQVSFIQNYIKKALESNDIDAKLSCLILCDTLGRICYLQEFKIVIPKLPELLLDQRSSLSALTLSSVLSSYNEIRELLKSDEIKDALTRMTVPIGYETYRTALLQ